MNTEIRDYLFNVRPGWVSTKDLVTMFAAGRSNARQQVWVILRRLEGHGMAERDRRPGNTYWRYKR